MRRILSIDGGGIRGVFPAAYLAHLEDDLDQPIHQYFDLIAGTSTGGIIAIGLAMGLRAKNILEMYESRGPEIFSQQHKGIRGWIERAFRKLRWLAWGPKYQPEALENALKVVLGEQKIGDAKTRLMIPAWHQESRRVYIYKTAHHQRLSTDYKELARDAAMASASAPTYFRKYVTARDVGLVDGGIWANNPTGIAVAEGICTLGWKPLEIRVLSIGCLEDVTEMRDAYGAARLVPKITGLFLAGQSHGANGLAHILTGHVGGSSHKAIYRVSPPVQEGIFTLDDTDKIQKLKSWAIVEARKDKPDLSPVFFYDTIEPFEPIHR